MNLHSLARSCPASRELLVRRISDERWHVDDAARAAGVSTKTAYKWLSRFRSDGVSGLRDRSSRPLRMPRLTASEWQLQVITLRREHRMTSPAIARQLRLPRSTVCRILRRAGISRLRDLDPPPVVRRYEKQRPGELVHVDIKKLGRFERAGKRVTDNPRQANRGIGWAVQAELDSAQFHEGLSAADERQSRALHPDTAAGMGLRQGLRLVGAATRSPAAVATPLQPSPTSWQSRRRNALRKAKATRMNNVSRHHS